jgi:hypothetical protein
MRTLELIRFTADILDRKPGTVEARVGDLQDKGLINKGTRGRFGGADMTESDGVNAILAVALDHPRGECVAASVQGIRSLPLTLANYNPLEAAVEDSIRSAFQFVRGLSLRPLDNLGAVLDGLVSDMRSGAFAAWAAGATADLVVDFHDNGQSVVMIIDRPQVNKSAVFQFMGPPGKPACTERIVRIRKPAFQGLANALGPVSPAIPPPPT